MQYFTEELSPPVEVEYKKINMPANLGADGDLTDVKFILKFQITPDQFDNLTIKMLVELNPSLQYTGPMASPPIPPQEYSFTPAGVCQLVYTTPENYYLKGTITVKAISPPNGQFDYDTKNFFFDLEFGKISEPPQAVEGLFILLGLDSSDYQN